MFSSLLALAIGKNFDLSSGCLGEKTTLVCTTDANQHALVVEELSRRSVVPAS